MSQGETKAKPLVFRQGGAADRLILGELRRHRSERGWPSPKEAEKSVAVPAGKAGPVTGHVYGE